MLGKIAATLSALVLLGLISCQPGTPSPVATAAATAGDLGVLAGTWKFSRFGPPTIMNDSMPEATNFLKSHLKEARIDFDRNGLTSLQLAGQANRGQARILEETPEYLKITFGGAPLIYDKRRKDLMMSIEVKAANGTGVLPTYFKKSR